MRRVVVTGMGCISALGHDVPAFWSKLAAGESGIAETRLIDPALLRAKSVAEVKDYDAETRFDPKDLAVLDRFSQFALIAAGEAIAQAGLDFREGDLGERTAAIVASGVGGMSTLEESYEKLYRQQAGRVHPFTIPKLMLNAAASQVTMRFGITGPSFAVASACSSASHAIGVALGMVRLGQVDVAVTGGSEAVITLGTLKGWEALRVMSPDTCRPFCADRKGMVLGEGAGILVIESLEHAQARGAEILAEVAGFGMSADAGDLVQPSMQGAARAIGMALRDAGLNPEDVAYVNAHGTGTPANDPTETKALHAVFGDHARRLAVSSTKSMHGHALGAAGAIEAMATIGAIRHGVVPPTANFTRPDPACDLDYVPNVARPLQVRAALSNSFAFGGLNAVVAFRAYN